MSDVWAEVHCPRCHKDEQMSGDDFDAGKRASCPDCGTAMVEGLSEPPHRVVVHVHNGLVESVEGDDDVAVIVLDEDTGGCDDESARMADGTHVHVGVYWGA